MSGLKFMHCTDEDGFMSAHYELQHSTVQTPTTLTLGLKVSMVADEFYAELTDCTTIGNTTEDALDKLAEWLERAAVAIRVRGEPKPLICDYSKYGDAS